MPVLNKDEFFSAVSAIVGDNTSEEALQFIENMTDTYAALEETGNDERVAELEQQLRDQNDAWSKRYKERFFSGGRVNALSQTELEEEQELVNEDIRIDDLFSDEEEPPKPSPEE